MSPTTGGAAARISAVMITKDAERHLARALAALAWCDEVLVVDSGSSDRTLEIARAHGARVERQDWLGFARQKQRAVDLARNDWVLVVDADEVLDAEAVRAIAELDLADPALAWRIRRRTYIGRREVRHGVWSPDWTLRLFNRTRARFNDVPVHESVGSPGTVRDLAGAMDHYSFADYADVFTRMGGYARLKAAAYRARGRRAGVPALIVRAGWGFVRSYVLKRGFLDGMAGVVAALSLSLDMVVPLALASDPAGAGEPVRPAAGPGPAAGQGGDGGRRA